MEEEEYVRGRAQVNLPQDCHMRKENGKPATLSNIEFSRYMSDSNLSESNVSACDTISESSDTATLLSLSREELLEVGAGSIREDVRVSRKRLEALIVRDLFVRIYGHDANDVNEAKQHILADLAPSRDLRINLKMEISYTDHSHLIGFRGATIRRVMEDTVCHIHFPDSNRMSKEHKSNQVTIAGGSIYHVEQARTQVRELSPLIFQFVLPIMPNTQESLMNPDAHNVFFENIQSSYNVQITVHAPNKLRQTSVSVKGCERDAIRVKEAVLKIMGYFTNGMMYHNFTVESTMEISPIQHPFVRAINDSNVHTIMLNTGAKVIFPDLSDVNIQQIKRSRIYISGELNAVYHARQQLVGSLPLRMMFDLSDDFQLEWEKVRNIATELNVNIKLINRNRGERPNPGLNSLPPMVPGRSRTMQLVAAERNTYNIYEARRRIFGFSEPPHIANIPSTYALKPIYSAVMPPGRFGPQCPTGRPGNIPTLMMPPSPNLVSPVLSPSFWPPTPFCSPTVPNFPVSPRGDFIPPRMIPHQHHSSGHSFNQALPAQNRYFQYHMNNNNNNNFKGNNNGFNQYGSYSQNLHPQMMDSRNLPTGMKSPTDCDPRQSNINRLKPLLTLPTVENLGANNHTCPNSRSFCSEESPGSAASQPSSSGISSASSAVLFSTTSQEKSINELSQVRRAPGYERANTMPNLYPSTIAPSSTPPSLHSRGGTPEDSNGNLGNNSNNTSQGSNISPTCGQKLMPEPYVLPGNVVLTDKQKKYKAIQAVYGEKVGSSPRAPTGEWSGCGFSKTHLSLFPKEGTDNSADKNEDIVGGRRLYAEGRGMDNKTGCDGLSASRYEDSSGNKTPLGAQKSNLLDFSSIRQAIDEIDCNEMDLPCLLIQNGLEKYIDTFLSQEIDLEAFGKLNEEDFKSLGITSFPARKKLQILAKNFQTSTYTGSFPPQNI